MSFQNSSDGKSHGMLTRSQSTGRTPIINMQDLKSVKLKKTENRNANIGFRTPLKDLSNDVDIRKCLAGSIKKLR